MAIDLYYTAGSAPCRLVLLVAAALDLQLNLKPMNLRAGDQLQPDFLKINPEHTVPTIVDDDFALWESRAIIRYLVNQYGNGSSLYPVEPKERALVDQRLDFDLGTLYPKFAEYFGHVNDQVITLLLFDVLFHAGLGEKYPSLFRGSTPNEEKLKALKESLIFFDVLLEGRTFAAGPWLTLGDLSLVTTVSTMEAAQIDLKPYPNVSKWYKLVKSSAKNYEETIGEGIKAFKQLVAEYTGVKTEL